MEDDAQKEIEQELKQDSINKWKIASGILGVILLVTFFMGDFGRDNSLTGSAVAEKTVNYINTNLLQGQGVATVKSVEDAGDNYNIKLSINGQEFDAYVTKDGKLLFPQVVDLEAEPPVIQQQASQNNTQE